MGNLVDLELDDESQLDFPTPLPVQRMFRYPPGCRICLCDEQLDKLGLDADCDVGDYLDMRVFGTIISVHKENGNRRVEIQLEKMAVEDEMAESLGENDD